jgi:hypothetical protein
MEGMMPQDSNVSINDLLRKIGFMSVQLDVAADTIAQLKAEIEKLNTENEDTKVLEEKQK